MRHVKNIVTFLIHLMMDRTITRIIHSVSGMKGTIISPTFSQETPSELTSYKLGQSETQPDWYKYSCGLDVHDKQLVAEPSQVAQGLWQVEHTVPDKYSPAKHEATQVL